MKPLQVAVGVVKNAAGQILIALRDQSLHQGGLWEFPGGKLEPAETLEQALIRELKEELNLTVESAVPLITITHQYADRNVELHVFLVQQFSGLVKGCQGQPLRWANPDALAHYAFPDANKPIITAARLPSYYAILDAAEEAELLVNLTKILNKGVKLIQARLKALPAKAVESFLEQAYPLCQRQGCCLLINSAVEQAYRLSVDGIHLTARHLLALDERPKNMRWLAASCHNLSELQHALKIGVDFVVLAPVLSTATHPGAKELGWEKFAELALQSKVPVYALGGMTLSCLDRARQAGAQGIAAIRCFLD
jgi:8-oxo-dGTP diphosphatase